MSRQNYTAHSTTSDIATTEVDTHNKKGHVLLDAHSDPFAPREGKTLTWKSVNMVLTTPSPTTTADSKGKDTEQRMLLDNVWGEVPAKQTTALMGPSGAGE